MILMGRRKLNMNKLLKHEVKTRVSEPTFSKLQDILNKKPDYDMSSLVRDILENRQIRVYTYDCSLDKVMEELAALRGEIKAIGININQVVRSFNSYTEPRKREFYAKVAFDQYNGLNKKIDQVFEIISKLSKKWLSE